MFVALESKRIMLVAAAIIAMFVSNGRHACTASPPNVIVILADDLAVGDLTSDVCQTPSLNRLAGQSLVFEQAYSGSCVCAPARAALLTGRYPHRTGVVTLNMNRYPQWTRLHRDETTMADVFRDAGYRTGLIGKWHTGRGDGFRPTDRGFDEFEGFDGSDVVSYHRYRMTVAESQTAPIDDSDYLTDDLSRRAIEFVRRHRDRPFLLHLAHYAPHRPLEAPEAVVQRYRERGLDENTATIYAMIEVMDAGIGRLMDELQTLGLADRTIVMFASDNGPDPLTGERPNESLRGTKYQIHEGGIRVPLMIRWPEQIEPGRTGAPVQFIDILPTLADCCQIPCQTHHPIDGASIRPILTGEAPQRDDWTSFWQWNRGKPNYTHNAAMRRGTLKLVRPFVTRNIPKSRSSAKPQLFDLATDPLEQQDLSESKPSVTRQMDRDLQRWSESVEADRRAEDGRRSASP